MCGRYALTTPPEVLAALLKLQHLQYDLFPRYNIAPTQTVPVVRVDDRGGRELVGLHWGLIPSWAKDRSIALRLINARSEMVDAKPAFRHAFKKRRCVIPADGFYEWKKIGKRKQPYFIHRADGSPMLFAGLWEQWTDRRTGEHIESFTILTTEPNTMLVELHNRMPVVLGVNESDQWLDPRRDDADELKTLLQPAPDAWFVMHPVSTQVGSPTNEGPGLIEPVAGDQPPSGTKNSSLGLFD